MDVTDKAPTCRTAVARGEILVSREVLNAVLGRTAAKGDVLGVARVAGIMAAKRTGELIPLCHPLALSHVSVDFTICEERRAIQAECTARLTGKTGVEMEALTGIDIRIGVALLTIYDMCKGPGQVHGPLRYLPGLQGWGKIGGVPPCLTSLTGRSTICASPSRTGAISAVCTACRKRGWSGSLTTPSSATRRSRAWCAFSPIWASAGCASPGGSPWCAGAWRDIIAAIKAIPGIEAVYLTTNGLALQEQLPGLLAAGLDGVNLSLDTLDRAQYAAITRRDALPQALAGLEAALAAPGLTVNSTACPWVATTASFPPCRSWPGTGM